MGGVTSRLPLPLLLACVAALMSCTPIAQAATPTMSLTDPITDNYKASFNPDPSKPELRTWLAMQRVEVAGTTWAPVAPRSIQVVSGGTVVVQGADGRAGRLVVRTTSGPFGSPLVRIDPVSASSGGRWGILAAVTDRGTLRTTPGVVALTLLVGSQEFGAGVVEYRYDAKFANAPAGNIEFNGPGGRWFVGGVPARSQEEPAPAVAPTLLAGSTAAAQPVVRPRITSIVIPVRSSTRAVPFSVRGRAGVATARITQLRVKVGAQRWSGWIRTRAGYSVVLPPGLASYTVSFQLRDSRGISSTIASRRVSCICG